MRALRNGVTVRDLIEELQSMDPNARVVFAYTANDYWRTQVARVVQSVDEAEVTWSEYHRLPKPVSSDASDDERPECDEIVDVVVLNLDARDEQ